MSRLIDLANKKKATKTTVDFLREHSFKVFLWPAAWKDAKVPVPLNWSEVEFTAASRNLIPKEKGIYAFVIEICDSIMPPHGVIAYIGQTGHESGGTLRKRFGEYLRDKGRGSKRPLVEDLFTLWSADLKFCFAEIKDPTVDLHAVECTLNDAVIPRCVVNDFTAEIRSAVKVLRSQ